MQKATVLRVNPDPLFVFPERQRRYVRYYCRARLVGWVNSKKSLSALLLEEKLGGADRLGETGAELPPAWAVPGSGVV